MMSRNVPFDENIHSVGALNVYAERFNPFQVYDQLTVVEKAVFNISYDNPRITQAGIAELLQISQQRVSKILSNIRKKANIS